MNNLHSSSFTALETLPLDEMQQRHQRLAVLMERFAPQASGLMVFSRLNIYYLTGTLANGILWLPREGNAALLVRKGLGRARLESPLVPMAMYRSYKEISPLLEELGSPLGTTVVAEMGGLTWAMADMLKERLLGVEFVGGDDILSRCRMVKTPWELAKMREAGRRHAKGVQELLPRHIHAGMSEAEIARQCITIFLELDHGGQQRMSAPGEEVFFGHVAAGDSGNYPHYFNGPMGYRGQHPAAPCLGSETIWQKGSPLTVDMAFTWQGYITDKTQTFWPEGPHTVPDEARRAYDFCVEIQQQAAQALRPGITPAQIWQDTLARVEQSPFRAGFMGLGENQVPFLGHGIGLAIDERPVVAKGFSEPLVEGMVLALEPKIGLPGLGMVGIENTFEVTSQGGVCLTGDSMDMIFIA